ncbi:ABC transporter permease [Roseinatronobacter bogoriensis]|uniref:Amino acid ABC transporter permease n=1 Tax=Roseinatronobacter bogoriensis subsp. barguzinensis TaxID=441209 RepID=A0A2K8KBY2_9RHOB|nr:MULTISPECIES: ABC transporter permease subunit [Rhodobaca]ATX66924.1 amino acid ABC transporter permease [Rhodobaca barguzinensis]MBB4206407.1 polar amino acid transport system permease protein [Rhodobaca bogoriensis DSM 18756]TDW41151.1 polar amino acid transport system permease protein [Rhodobaca barguzinensis]TDY74671.1 amino acid ABC transporter membrane protein 2 (PAAT family) [Rhodobaca bogoriensis DSM 18756]
MRTCAESFEGYILRALGRDFGERLLPRNLDITLCDQLFLIASGLIWNVYFAGLAILFGFFLAVGVAVAKFSENRLFSIPASTFVFVFRGSPLFIQFFFFYSAFVLLPRTGIDIPLGFVTLTVNTSALTTAQVGGLIVLILNTTAYSAELFYGALRSIPKGDLEAADAYGMNAFTKFRRVVFPSMLRLAWPSYTNEAIFLTHSTTLVFLSAFPARQQAGEAFYYARYFVDQTFNPFVAYPIVAGYFVLLTLTIIGLFGLVNRRLNRHLPKERRQRIRFRPQYIR